MAITKKDLQEYREEKTTELDKIRVDRSAAEVEIEEKVKAFRKPLDDDLKAEFDTKESSIQGSLIAIDKLIEKAGEDEIPIKEEL